LPAIFAVVCFFARRTSPEIAVAVSIGAATSAVHGSKPTHDPAAQSPADKPWTPALTRLADLLHEPGGLTSRSRSAPGEWN
jgi:hypothetical protein